MSQRPNFKFTKITQQSIKQMNQSKQMDAIQKQLEMNEKYLQSQFYQHQNSIKSYLMEEAQSQIGKKTIPQTQLQSSRHIKQQSIRKDNQNNVQKINRLKFGQYHSGSFHSTQPTSPYRHNFATQRNFKVQRQNDMTQGEFKKKLFFQDQQKNYTNSPIFNDHKSILSSNDLTFTFKKKIDEYQRQFANNRHYTQSKDFEKRKVSFYFDNMIQNDTLTTLNTEKKSHDRKQNDLNTLNIKQTIQKDIQDDSSLNKIKRVLNFQSVDFIPLSQNPIIKQINHQLIRSNQQKSRLDDAAYNNNLQYQVHISRKNQSDHIKKKILESKSDLKQFYQIQNNNVQYEYRKAKFMDIFLGTNILQHDKKIR